MSNFHEEPAVIMMLDATRGDLFAVVTMNGDHVVRVDRALPGADQTVHDFRPGKVGIDGIGRAIFIRLHPNTTNTTCSLVQCTAPCPVCGAAMQPAGQAFVCTGCGQVA